MRRDAGDWCSACADVDRERLEIDASLAVLDAEDHVAASPTWLAAGVQTSVPVAGSTAMPVGLDDEVEGQWIVVGVGGVGVVAEELADDGRSRSRLVKVRRMVYPTSG